MIFTLDDGGRSVAGFKGHTGDCVVRAIAIAAQKPYREVYDALFELGRQFSQRRGRVAARVRRRGGTPRNGVHRKVYQPYLESLGFAWVPTMQVGQGCRVHLCDGELPGGRLVVAVSRHLTAVIDGVIHDTFDPQRATIICEEGVQRIAQRCVYGYYRQEGTEP